MKQMKKKVIVLALASLSTINYAARPLTSGDVAGRDLNVPGLGWVGHVGIGTGDDVGWPTQIIIETLNVAPKPVI
jgi:hypothetical protein